MTGTLPVERDLRRVIGDGETQPDGEVDGLDDADRIEVVCDRPLPLQVVGEDLGDVDRAVFEAERGAVEVAV